MPGRPCQGTDPTVFSGDASVCVGVNNLSASQPASQLASQSVSQVVGAGCHLTSGARCQLQSTQKGLVGVHVVLVACQAGVGRLQQ